jgi:hypothetical protein
MQNYGETLREVGDLTGTLSYYQEAEELLRSVLE